MAPSLSAALRERAVLYARLVRLDRPIGILLLLWPTLTGLWIAARGMPEPRLLLVFAVGTVLMRSAGCAANDLADRRFDAHVRRTRERPLAAGRIHPLEAALVTGVLATAAATLVMMVNLLTMALSVVALALAFSYPLTKRFLAIPQAYLGIAFGFGIPMAFAAQLGTVTHTAWLLLLANVFWAIAYDTAYAMVDREDDLRIGIKTSAITLGRLDVAAVMACHAAALILQAAVGVRERLGVPYFAGLVAAAGLAASQYRLIRDRDPALCFRAFLHNNRVGAAVFAGTALDFLLRA